MSPEGRREAPPAYVFFGVFTGFPDLFPQARRLIEERFGPIHPRGESPVYPFPETRAYRSTMGERLQRKFFVIAQPWEQDKLADVKHAALTMEAALARSGSFPVARPINIDPGLINDCRVILASTKDHAHRLYRGAGIWEEITLLFQEGYFRPLPWTYPDFRAPTYHEFLAYFRRLALELGRPSPPPCEG
jgi:hypothetical protein